MDFIKTSSLRALIELTFQRNWNGLIWMSRKGVTTKRVKTVQTALSRISAQPRSPAGRETCSALGQSHIRPSEVSAKVQTDRPITQHDPGNIVPRSATHNARHAAHDQSRASREQASRPRNPFAYHGRCIRPSRERTSRVRPRTSAKSHPPTTPADRESIRPRPFRLGHDPTVRPIVPTDRPNAAVDPKPVLKPKLSYFQARLNPKPPLKDLALYIYF
ncbi:unnamed protein product [Microthlaspi erraticum]|uniref:Uncharacterized protein n=1 Tax=Microthlaspi erraticum TaxID=1685480 RepID=A0A6D2J1X6_9BRAS|nr:unnamed protein product [Microthlaspi erraticum]